MRFQFSDAERARRLAKSLKRSLAAAGLDQPLHVCRTIVAEACGYPNFHEVEQATGREGASPLDEHVAAGVRAQRRLMQVAALTRHGVPIHLAPAIVQAVSFTSSHSSRNPQGDTNMQAVPVAEPTSPPAGPDRSERVQRNGGHSGYARNLRAGNAWRSVLLDVNGVFVGLALGEDSAHEHSKLAEGICEALGTAENAATVRDAIMTRHVGARVMRFVDGRGQGDKCGTTLIINNRQAEDLRYKKYWLSRKGFVSEDDNTGMWRAESGIEPEGIVTGWSFDGFGLVGWDEEARGRIEQIHGAYQDGSLAVALSHGLGPILLLSERFDQGFPLEPLVRDIDRKRHAVGGRGSALVPAELTIATRASELDLARPPAKPKVHRFAFPDGATVDVARDVDALESWTGEFGIAGAAGREMSVWSKGDRCYAPIVPGAAMSPEAGAFRIGTVEGIVRDGTGPDADALRRALLEGDAFVAGETLTFPVGEPVWRLSVVPKGLLCTLDLAGNLGPDDGPEAVVPVWNAEDVRRVGALIGLATGVRRVKQVGRLDHANPFSGKAGFAGLNLRLLASRADAAFVGWGDPSLADAARSAAAALLAQGTGTEAGSGGKLPEPFEAFADACAEVYLEASARGEASAACGILGAVLHHIGKVDVTAQPAVLRPAG